MVETGDVLNWFDITAPEGYLSINDRLDVVMKHPRAMILFAGLMKDLQKQKAKEDKAKGIASKGAGMDMSSMMKNEDMMKMMGAFTVKRMFSMLGTAGLPPVSKEQILKINSKLNKIKK